MTVVALLGWVSPVVAQDKLIPEASTWRYFKGTQAPPADWNALEFEDSTWTEGQLPIGYSTDLTYNTTLADMQNGYLSVFCRHKFSAASPDPSAKLTLRAKYDDGFVAYLNGTEVLRKGLSGTPVAYNATATDHETNFNFEDTVLPCTAAQLLKDGDNVLAVQLHNTSLGSSDASLEIELVAEEGVPGESCPLNFKGTVMSDNIRIRLTWNRPAGVTYKTLKILRNDVELPTQPTSPNAVAFIDTEPLVGENRYKLLTTGCEDCVSETTVTMAPPVANFRRGDSNIDGTLNLTDAVFVLDHLFRGGDAPKCPDAADVNDDGDVNLSDPVYLLRALFMGGDPPPSPADTCGPDPSTNDPLADCVYDRC